MRRDSIIGNAVVLKTTARKGLQVRVLFSPPFHLSKGFARSRQILFLSADKKITKIYEFFVALNI